MTRCTIFIKFGDGLYGPALCLSNHERCWITYIEPISPTISLLLRLGHRGRILPDDFLRPGNPVFIWTLLHGHLVRIRMEPRGNGRRVFFDDDLSCRAVPDIGRSHRPDRSPETFPYRRLHRGYRSVLIIFRFKDLAPLFVLRCDNGLRHQYAVLRPPNVPDPQMVYPKKRSGQRIGPVRNGDRNPFHGPDGRIYHRKSGLAGCLYDPLGYHFLPCGAVECRSSA